jgi:glutamyl-tRNA reductase
MSIFCFGCVYLYDLDSLQSIAKQTLAVRQQESEKCLQLIERHVEGFQLWVERASYQISQSLVELPGVC